MSSTDKKHPDQERALHRRKQILEAAECCFSRSGFHGASMAEISKAAGMSAGHIYNYFDGKDAIIAAFVQANVERVSAKILGMAQRDDPLQAAYDDIERSVREDIKPGIWKMPLEIFAEASRNPMVAELVQEADRHTRAEFRKLLRAGREKRGMASDDATLDGRIEIMVAFFQGLHVRSVHNPSMNMDSTVAAMRLALWPLLFNE